MPEPLFLAKADVLALHKEHIRIYGGSHGLADEPLLESALAAPEHTYYWDNESDIFDLAASYVFSLAGNHPFIDGNKRVAAAAGINFLKINGLTVESETLYLVALIQSLVTHSCDKKFAGEYLFLGCLPNIIEEACKIDADTPPPPSFLAAESKEEKSAMVTDYVTVKMRMNLIEACQSLTIQPKRFDGVLDYVEAQLFKKVASKWRVQFGMPVDEAAGTIDELEDDTL